MSAGSAGSGEGRRTADCKTAAMSGADPGARSGPDGKSAVPLDKMKGTWREIKGEVVMAKSGRLR